MDNCSYDKVKVLYKLCRLSWFIEKHAMQDAIKAGDSECAKDLEKLKFDLQKHIERFQKEVYS